MPGGELDDLLLDLHQRCFDPRVARVRHREDVFGGDPSVAQRRGEAAESLQCGAEAHFAGHRRVRQVASVGLTEAAAKEQGYKVKVGRFPFMGNGKAIALGEPEGLVKTVFDEKTGELLGAHMIGAEVTEMIQGYVIGKTAELTEAEFMHTVFPHPTLSEMMHESVLDAYGKAIHF